MQRTPVAAGNRARRALKKRLPHCLAIRLYAKPPLERQRSLLEEHRQTVSRRATPFARGPHPRCATLAIDKVEHRGGWLNHRHLQRLRIVVLADWGSVDDQGRAVERLFQRRFNAGDIAKPARQSTRLV